MKKGIKKKIRKLFDKNKKVDNRPKSVKNKEVKIRKEQPAAKEIIIDPNRYVPPKGVQELQELIGKKKEFARKVAFQHNKRLIPMLRDEDKKLTASRDGEIYLLDIAGIIYIETIDRKTFVYTKGEVYESSLKLYELEQQLCDYGFFRAGKSSLVQLKYIKSLKMDINRRIKVTLENGEQLMVSRQYADELKKRLGVK